MRAQVVDLLLGHEGLVTGDHGRGQTAALHAHLSDDALGERPTHSIDLHLQGQPPHTVLQIDEKQFKQLDENGLNAVLYQRSKDQSVADVLAGLQRSHAQVVADLERWSYEDLMKPHYPDDPEANPLMNWVVGNTYEHYQEHLANIQKAMKAG